MNIYLDNQTSTRPSSEVVEAMIPFFKEWWGSPIAPHHFGSSLHAPIDNALKGIYQLIGARDEDHFIFTSSGAEAVNHVLFSTYVDITRKTGKNHFITSIADEAPAIVAMERLQELGCIHHLAPIDCHGKITAQAIADSITPRTALISLSWANGMTGVVHSLKEISKLCQDRGILFHVDATHVLGKGYFPWEESGADILTFNGEQLHAPKGTGGIFIRNGIEISPFILGGSEQGGMRGGSLNVAGLIGLGKAAVIAREVSDFICTEISRLRDIFENLLLKKNPQCILYFRDEDRLPTSVVASFPGVASDALLYLLSRKGVYASLGGGNFQQISHLMKAAGIHTQSALSFSLSKETTEEEIEKAVERIGDAYSRLKKCSDFLPETL